MGKNGIFVMLLVAVFTLALQPSLVNYSFAGGGVDEICDDGIDNDMDSLIDLDDPDCHVILLKPVPGALPELPGFEEDPLEDPLLGDFKCYDAYSPPPNIEVLLEDQFHDERVRVLDVERVCNHVMKLPGDDYPGSVEPSLSEQHYKVYNIIDEPFQEDVLLKDQWGTTRHTMLTPTELWVPQVKLHSFACPPPFSFNFDTERCEVSTPDEGLCFLFGGTFLPPDVCVTEPNPDSVFPIDGDDIHWKCYDVPPKVPDELFDVQTLDPNFNFEPVQSTVIQLDKICAPVEKTVLECPDGSIDIGDDLCQLPTGDVIPRQPVTFGDSTIPDHLTCYDVRGPILEPGNNFGVTYAGQFQSDIFDIIEEREICLVATKIHVPETAIGGTFIPIDSTALLIVAAQTTASWLIPVVAAIAGIGIVVVRKISNKKE